tara:strand:- start:2520 stop:3233 length:714 start_codon:yes stop_codon:yes gene_type:complete
MSDKTWRSTVSTKMAIAACVLMPVAALGTKFGLWPFTIGFLVLAASILLALFTIVIAAIYILKEAYSADKPSMRNAALLAFVPMAIVAAIVAGAGDVPPIHNITTNLANPPTYEAVLPLRAADSNPLEITPAVAAVHSAGYSHLKPVVSDLSAEQAIVKAEQLAQSMGWIIVPDQRDNYIEATVTSFWFGFTDDIVIRVTPAQNGSIIDLRSVSRVGKSDLGANAKRINVFITAFNQ